MVQASAPGSCGLVITSPAVGGIALGVTCKLNPIYLPLWLAYSSSAAKRVSRQPVILKPLRHSVVVPPLLTADSRRSDLLNTCVDLCREQQAGSAFLYMPLLQ
jgi:hypothetical protein